MLTNKLIQLLFYLLPHPGIVSDPLHHNLAQRSHASIPADSHDSSHWLESFRLLALELDIEIVPGTIVERRKAVGGGRVDGKDEVLVNVAHYISGEGKILGRYEKVCSRSLIAYRNWCDADQFCLPSYFA